MIRGDQSMLKLVSRFVLEVLPYVLTALIAAIVEPGFFGAQLHGTQPSGAYGAERASGAFELARNNHAGYASEQVLVRSALHNQPITK
jgi:hypothetical protein